jgi:hypothetical protein
MKIRNKNSNVFKLFIIIEYLKMGNAVAHGRETLPKTIDEGACN